MDFVNCENCGASMTPTASGDYFLCEYCGSYAFPEPSPDGVVALGEEAAAACPVCSTTMSRGTIAGLPVLHCAKCRGILAPQEAFSTLVRLMRARATGEPDALQPVDQGELGREILCPYCQNRMTTHPYYGPGNVVIDNCPACAVIWLDHGELKAIRDAPGRDRGRADSPEYSIIEDLLGARGLDGES